MPMPRSKPSRSSTGERSPKVPGAERTTVRESGDLLLVESPTAEAALERLSALLGPDVEIVAAGKVTRGGIGGFFAREMVQLSARAPSRPAPGSRLPSPAPAPPRPVSPGERAVASLLNGTGRPTAPAELHRRAEHQEEELHRRAEHQEEAPPDLEVPAHLRMLLSQRVASPPAP